MHGCDKNAGSNSANTQESRSSQPAWQLTTVILAPGRLRKQNDPKFETSLEYRVRPCLKKRKKKSKQVVINL